MKPLITSVAALISILPANNVRADKPIAKLSELPDFFREHAATWVHRSMEDSGGDERAGGAWFQVEARLNDYAYWAAALGLRQTEPWIRQNRFAGVVRSTTRDARGTKSAIFVLLGAEHGTMVEFSRVESEWSSGLPNNLPVFGVLDDARSVVCILFPGSTKFVNLEGGVNVVFDPAYGHDVVRDYGGVESLTNLWEITTHADDFYLNTSENFLALHRSGRGFVGSVGWEGVWTNRHGGAGGPDPDEANFNPSQAIRRSKDAFQRWAKAYETTLASGESNGWLSAHVWNWDVEGPWASITIDKRNPQVGDKNLSGRMFRVQGVAINDSLNMRTGPSSEDRIVKKLASNASGIRMVSTVAVHDQDGDWAFVSYAGLLGWVKFKFLELESLN